MKKIMTLLSLMMLALAGSANDSQAISFTFKFKVFSSGASMYACNAGIRHKLPNTQYCYIAGTQNTCTPAPCSAKTGCQTQCVCSGVYGGAYRDYMRANTRPWTDNKAYGDNIVQTDGTPIKPVAGPTDGSFATITSDLSSWNTEITELNYDFGTELYGDDFFVDICYRGPQMENFATNEPIDYYLNANTTEDDFLATGVNGGDNSEAGLQYTPIDGTVYSQLAGLQVKAYYTCDMQGSGAYQYGENGSSASSGTYNTTLNEAIFGSLDANGYPATGGDIFGSSGNFTPVSSNGVNEFTGVPLIGWGTQAPRFCKVRYVWSETNPHHNLRKWARHGGEFCTQTSIEDPAK